MYNSNGSSHKIHAKREMKFHMHDAQARKTSESYEKIRRAIILRIQEPFEDSINVVESLRKKQKIVKMTRHMRPLTANTNS